MRTRLGTRLMRKVKKLPPQLSVDDFRAEVYDLKAPFTNELYIIILDYYLSYDGAKKGKKGRVPFPYQGKVPGGRRRNHEEMAESILYNFNKFPELLQQILLKYVEYMLSR